MPSYFVSVQIEANMVSFVFDSENEIHGKNWQEVYNTICNAVNQTLTNAGQQPQDFAKMTILTLSRL